MSADRRAGQPYGQASQQILSMMNALPPLNSRGLDSGIDGGASSPDLMMQTSPPMSRTHQYRKIMKPMLERKRRARINKCLDSLKELMVSALQSEGESITKLEKADVLELTVKHLRKLKKHNALALTPQITFATQFKAGYSCCAHEVSNFLNSDQCGSVDPRVSAGLLTHLAGCVKSLDSTPPPPSSPTPSSTTSSPPAASASLPSSTITGAHSPIVSLKGESDSALDLSRKAEKIPSRKRQLSSDEADFSSASSDESPASKRLSKDSGIEIDPHSWRPW